MRKQFQIPKPHPPRRAQIISEDRTAKYVKDEYGKLTVLVKGSINSTPHPVGTKGLIQYRPGTSFALDFFTADTGKQ